MIKRIVLATALLALPLALTPADASAQDRGTERAAGVSAAASNANQAMPAGMDKRPEGQALPPGMLLTRPPAETQPPAPETNPDEGSDECMVEVQIINGIPTLVDCNGNPVVG